MRKIYPNPNFTIVLPGGCNAECAFCFWEKTLTAKNYLVKLDRIFREMEPGLVTQISISGGEPTLSPFFNDVMELLREYKFPKVVLTSNGHKLHSKIWEVKDVVKHVNISRLSSNDNVNIYRFGGTGIPSTANLTLLCNDFNVFGIDVNINYVYTDESRVEEFDDMIGFCKDIGASTLTIRNDYNIKDAMKMNAFEELIKDSKVIMEGSCPVCVTRIRRYRGMEVRFKYSEKNPSEVVKGVYEFVFQPDGKLYSDWESKSEIKSLQGLVPMDDWDGDDDLFDEEDENWGVQCGVPVYTGPKEVFDSCGIPYKEGDPPIILIKEEKKPVYSGCGGGYAGGCR